VVLCALLEPIAERYGLDLTVVNKVWIPLSFYDSRLGWSNSMNPASPYAMVDLIQLKDHFDIAFACDTIMTTRHYHALSRLIITNHYLSVATHITSASIALAKTSAW